MRVLMRLAALAVGVLGLASATADEYNPIVRHPVSIGPEAGRLIVAFKITAGSVVTHTISSRLRTRKLQITQAQTRPAERIPSPRAR